MRIIGIRTAPATLRYAVVDWDGSDAEFINAAGENKIDFPADLNSIEEKLHWLHQELDRIFRQYPDVDRIVVKTNEFGRGGESSASREAAYLDAMVLLMAGQKPLPISTKVYRSIGTKRKEVKQFAEEAVGKSDSYWNEQMADAVAAAWSGRE